MRIRAPWLEQVAAHRLQPMMMRERSLGSALQRSLNASRFRPPVRLFSLFFCVLSSLAVAAAVVTTMPLSIASDVERLDAAGGTATAGLASPLESGADAEEGEDDEDDEDETDVVSARLHARAELPRPSASGACSDVGILLPSGSDHGRELARPPRT